MGETLRQIALTVEQDGGGYSWLLIERADGKVFVLKRAARQWTSYLRALEAGYQELALLSACGLHRRDTGNLDGGAREAANAPAIGFTETHDAL